MLPWNIKSPCARDTNTHHWNVIVCYVVVNLKQAVDVFELKFPPQANQVKCWPGASQMSDWVSVMSYITLYSDFTIIIITLYGDFTNIIIT